MKSFLGLNYLNLINSKNSTNYFYLLSAGLVLFGLFLGLTDRLDLSNSAIHTGDVPSYLLFPFHSLSEALSSHRTFGFPLLLQGFKLIDNDLSSLPLVLYVIYSLSLMFLYKSIVDISFKPIIALVICTSLLLNASFVSGLQSLTAATLVSILMVLILGMLFRLKNLNNYMDLAILSVLIFFLYQTRPNLAPLIILAPFWLFLINYYFRDYSFKSASILGLGSLLTNSFLLIIFLSIRIISIGEFGMNSFSGTVLSGQATSYLDEEIILELEGTPKILAVNILKRKAQLSAPCNKPKRELTHLDRHECGNVWIMTSWLATIKHFDKEEPFKDEGLNIEPWKHTELGPFFSRNNTLIDNSLSDYGRQIIFKEPKLAFSRMIYEYKFAFKSFLEMFTTKIPYLAAFGFLVISWLFQGRSRKRNNQLSVRKIYKMKEFHLFLVMLFISITYMLQGILVSGAMIHLDNRYISSSSIFFLTPILIFSILPYLFRSDIN